MAPPTQPAIDRFRLVTIGVIIVTILCFGLCFFALSSDLSQTSELLHKPF